MLVVFFFFKQKTAYEMRISDWSSDVCSSDLSRSDLSALRSGATVPGERRPCARGETDRGGAGARLRAVGIGGSAVPGSGGRPRRAALGRLRGVAGHRDAPSLYRELSDFDLHGTWRRRERREIGRAQV